MRRSIYIPGFSHGTNPIPAASAIGDMLETGAIFGVVRSSGALAERPEDQCLLMFGYVKEILLAAGGTLDDVLKMTFYLRPEVDRELINLHWVEAFPEPDSRPARHTIVSTNMPTGMAMQCVVVACLQGST